MNYLGPIESRDMAWKVGISFVGCPYRGTVTCWICTFKPAVECDYLCGDCPERYRCKCGWDQTAMLRAGGLVE